MKEILGKYFIENGELIHVNEFVQADSNYIIVYEVIRVDNFVPLFYEKHFLRLKKSVELLGIETKINNTKMFIQIERLISENNIGIGNIKIVLTINNQRNLQSTKLFFIPFAYPSEIDYTKGVDLISYNAERVNPNVKFNNLELRSEINKIISEKNVYEVLLYKLNRVITEGSRSNIFFIKDNVVYTAPSEVILKGITWEFVYEICKQNEIQIIEKEILIEDIGNYDSAFLTGTSPKILMISNIDNNSFRKNKLIQKIADEYNNIINVYSEKFTRCRL